MQGLIQDSPQEEAPTIRGGGGKEAPPYEFAQFSEKLHKIKKLSGCTPPLNPPMVALRWSASYRPLGEASEGYVLTGVCHSFCPTSGWGEVWQMHRGIDHMGGRREIHLLPWTSTSPWSSTSHHSPVEEKVIDLPPKPPSPHTHIRALWSMHWRAVRILLECIIVIVKFPLSCYGIGW